MTDYEVIGIDHGYKNIRTAHCIFPTAISEIETVPDDKEGILEYNGKVYTIDGKKVLSVAVHDKSTSEEFYLLTLVALAKELSYRHRRKVNVYIGAGLPVRWFDAQQESFRSMLMQHRQLHFTFEGTAYDVTILDAKIFKQGAAAYIFAAGDNSNCLIIDIGGETIDIIPVEDRKFTKSECKISTNATIWLIKMIQEKVESELYERIEEREIIKAIIEGPLHPEDEYLKIFYKCLTDYCTEQVYNMLREYKYNLSRTRLLFVGGGAAVIKNYGSPERYNATCLMDINANAKGYEALYLKRLKR